MSRMDNEYPVRFQLQKKNMNQIGQMNISGLSIIAYVLSKDARKQLERKNKKKNKDGS